MKQKSYEWLTNLENLKFENKSVLIIGAGEMAKHYAFALSHLHVNDITIISRTKKEPNQFNCKCEILSGGFEKHLPLIDKKDLVIIATPTPLLIPATKLSIESGQTNILVEKPGSLYHSELSSLMKKLKKQRVRIAYNRLLYPSFHKLRTLVEEDGGITSCRFNFTEWVHRIPFDKYEKDEYSRWGISNSLHVISMAMELIGMPRTISSFQSGKLDWHESGSIFVGSGISENGIPFSYHADWGGSGRWEIEIITRKNGYRLIPLEELYVCKKGTVSWEAVSLRSSFPDVKPGIGEEISVMLNNKIDDCIPMVSIERAIEYNKLAEKIFKYSTERKLS